MRRQTAEGIISSDEAAARRCLVIPPSDDGGDDATAAPRDIGTWAGAGRSHGVGVRRLGRGCGRPNYARGWCV